MLGLGLGTNKLRRRGGVFNLPSALHEWSFQNATDSGTIVTIPDTGSLGTLPMANPGAPSKPTIQSNYIDYDGVAQYSQNGVANFRGADATGVIHIYINFDLGTNEIAWSSSDSSTAVEYFLIQRRSGGELRFQSTVGGSTILETTAGFSGTKLVTIVQDGVQCYILIDGVEILAYDVSSLTTEWFGDSITNDMIMISGIETSGGFTYGECDFKYMAYAPYVSKATAISEANTIIASLG